MPKSMKLKDLAVNPNNPRMISTEKIAMLEKALAEFGDLSGIIYNRETNRLVGGHQRKTALPAESKITIVKTYKKPTKIGTCAEGFVNVDGENFYYREVSWNEAKEKAANIAANKGAGQWDFEQLTEWLHDLDTAGFDLDLTMFDIVERDRLLESEKEDVEKEWEGMPEFNQEDVGGIHIHLRLQDEEALKEFSKLIKQPITDKTKTIWYPPAPKEKVADKRYVSKS